MKNTFYKIIKYILVGMYYIGFIVNSILVLYVEWTYLRQSFFQIINPFLHLQVIIALLTMPIFWILLAITIVGYFGATSIEKHIKSE